MPDEESIDIIGQIDSVGFQLNLQRQSPKPGIVQINEAISHLDGE